jgi:hypothetical protein
MSNRISKFLNSKGTVPFSEQKQTPNQRMKQDNLFKSIAKLD